jgi:MFS family permease
VNQTAVAVYALFFANGVGWASWASRLPALTDKLGLSEGSLGLALFGATIGLFVAATSTAFLVLRFGSRLVTVLAGFAMCLVLPLIGLAPSAVAFAAALVAYGLSNGSFDLASNARAVVVERAAGRAMMSGFHALFSAGAIVGAASAALLAAADVPIEVHLSALGVLLGLVVLVAGRALGDGELGREATGPALAWPGRALLGVAALAFCVLLAEGAVFDWSAVYLSTVAGATPAVAAMGLAVFQSAMMVGRLAGDRAADRVGAATLVRTGAVVGGIGFAGALLFPGVPTVLVGYFLLGLGIAASFPLAMSAAARNPRIATSIALGATTASGYTGFVLGPPLIGFVAEGTNLQIGLAVVVVCLVAAAALAPAVRRG